MSESQQERGRVVELFDGRTLNGWHAVPRLPVAAWPGGPTPDRGSPEYLAAAISVGMWSVQDGAIVGTQSPGSGLGGYLLTDDRYGDAAKAAMYTAVAEGLSACGVHREDILIAVTENVGRGRVGVLTAANGRM